jgi:Homeodomain-like domain
VTIVETNIMTTPPTPHPGFRQLDMTSLIIVDPKLAEKKILAAYVASGASLRKAAKYLDCTERTLHRWVDKLKIRDELAKLTKKAQRDGTLDEHRRPVKS